MFDKKSETIENDTSEIVDKILLTAINEGASDVHIEPQQSGMMVRFRVDGILRIKYKADSDIFKTVMARIKIMSNLDTTGLPRPQEGKIMFRMNDRHVDLRVSIFPTALGECAVIRVLESIKLYKDYRDLGFIDQQVGLIENALKIPYGIILVTGPNGCGKSTTLFSMLNNINNPEKSIVTLEDPVERRIDMARQTQIEPDIGISFASGLRYLLRQDPDIIMVGEIRDKETAHIALEAAITGHLVLATIHTNNAASAIVRLINMEIEPFLIASSLKLIAAQRLARKLCDNCKEQFEPSEEALKSLVNKEHKDFFRSRGCDKCSARGTLGRVGIHEVLPITKEIGELILTIPTDEKINSLAKEQGMVDLREMAVRKAEEGLISLEEALRITV